MKTYPCIVGKRIVELTAEQRDSLAKRSMPIEERVAALEAEVEALCQDAQRYRWLRDFSHAHKIATAQATLMDGEGIKVYMTFPGVEPRTQPKALLFGEQLDIAIDAALAARPGGQHE